MNETVIQTYVWHKDRRYFISTIERDCSAVSVQTRYNETIVWDWPAGQEKRGALIFIDEDMAGSIANHVRICNLIYNHGEEVFEVKK